MIFADIASGPHDRHAELMKALSRVNRQWLRYVAVNCWHMSHHESAAMWNLYLKSDEGIAVQSTYARLRDSFRGDVPVLMGRVRYVDYETATFDPNNMFSPFVHKRLSFEHEREVRAAVSLFPVARDELDFSLETMRHGTQVPVDLVTLVEKVYVAPSAQDWLVDLVRAVVTKYGFAFPVMRSSLDEQPMF